MRYSVARDFRSSPSRNMVVHHTGDDDKCWQKILCCTREENLLSRRTSASPSLPPTPSPTQDHPDLLPTLQRWFPLRSTVCRPSWGRCHPSPDHSSPSDRGGNRDNRNSTRTENACCTATTARASASRSYWGTSGLLPGSCTAPGNCWEIIHFFFESSRPLPLP